MDQFPLDPPDGLPGYGLTLTASSLAPRTARALAASALDEWSLGDLRHDVDLVVSELVTNAVLRSPCAAFMITLLDADEIEVSVWDDAPGVPQEQEPDPASSIGGRGLLLVREFSNAWGCRPAPAGGKVAWARLGPKPHLDR